MTRRILAALVAASAVLLLVPVRVSGEPAATPTTTETAPATSTTMAFPFHPLAANPLTLYPRRPGAKYGDTEVRPGDSVTLLDPVLHIARARVEGHRALPRDRIPADTDRYTKLGLADGYTRTSNQTSGALLHVVVHATPNLFPVSLACTATAASDGTVLLPYARPPTRPVPNTTSTTEPAPAPVDLNFYLPLGARRGRFYLTCRTAFDEDVTGTAVLTLIGSDTRVVWAIDV